MPQLFMLGLSISRAPLQASTSSSWASSGKPSRTRNRSSFPEPRQLVAALRRRLYGKAAERAHQMLRLALAGLPRILTETDLDGLAVLGGGVEQQSLDVARIGPPAHHIQQPIAAIPIAAELDADGPVRVIELGLLGRGEIPVTNNIEIGRDLVDDGAPFPFEIEPGRRLDLPIATQQPPTLEQRQRQQPGEIFR